MIGLKGLVIATFGVLASEFGGTKGGRVGLYRTHMGVSENLGYLILGSL